MPEPGKFRKKPVVVQVYRFDGTAESAKVIAQWCGGRVFETTKPSDPTDVRVEIDIPTLEGVMTAVPEDYVIKGVHGEFYPCKPDIFEETYEVA